MIEDKREIIKKDKFDVIVVGGGIAGVSAAVSAARHNLKVFLVEKSLCLGGLATRGLISLYEPLCDGKGNKIIGGISEELIKLSMKYSFDNMAPEWGGSGKCAPDDDRYQTKYSPTVFSLAMNEFVINEGVKLRFDTYAVYPVMEENICKGIICESINGREFFEAKVVIDATGDASVAERAGIPTVIGKNYMSYVFHYYDKESAENFAKDGDICKFRCWKSCGSDMNGVGHPKGMKMLEAATAEDVSEYVIRGGKNALDFIKKHDKNTIDIMELPQMPQFRTIRRIVGESDFEAVDRKSCADNIGCAGDFRWNKRGCVYQIPYGSLYNKKADNIICAGRIISAPWGNGWEVCRVIPVCALTGEAAGNAAALCVMDNCRLSEVDIEKLQNLQRNNGNMMNFEG